MLNVDNTIKKLTNERSVGVKANETTRLQVTTILSDTQATQRRSGKLVTSFDSATGSIKRDMDSVAALNRPLSMSGTQVGAGLGLQEIADGGLGATDIFSGGVKQAPRAKRMMVRFLRYQLVLRPCVLVLFLECGAIIYSLPPVPRILDGICPFGPCTAFTSLLIQLKEIYLRTDHFFDLHKPLSMAGSMPDLAEKRMTCASRLDRCFERPGGVHKALPKLDTTILRPKKREPGEEQEFKPEKLYKVLQQAWPRFQRDLQKVMVPGFMRRASTLLASTGRITCRFLRVPRRGEQCAVTGCLQRPSAATRCWPNFMPANNDWKHCVSKWSKPMTTNRATTRWRTRRTPPLWPWSAGPLHLVIEGACLITHLPFLCGTTVTYFVSYSCMHFLSSFFLLRVPAVHRHAQQVRLFALHRQGLPRG